MTLRKPLIASTMLLTFYLVSAERDSLLVDVHRHCRT
jgi:hypothetical protein